MKKIVFTFILALAFSELGSGSAVAASLNELTPAEKSAGWTLLFDGKTSKGWRSFKKTTFPEKGWLIENGILKHVAKGGGGDLITDSDYNNFDLQWEWMVPAGANNGIKYLITEKRNQVIGHEYQMIDDVVAPEAKHSTGSFYDVLAPSKEKPLKPVGQWNHSRVLIQGNHVEHWLNGSKILTYELGSEEVLKAVQNSKFKSVPDFGKKMRGHIILTEHQDEASYKNIKIRLLP